MAIDTFDVSTPIKSSVDKFYDFFKFKMSELVNIFPASFKGVELLEGEEGTVGCVKLWHYILGGIPMTVKAKNEAIDDEKHSLTFAALEGDVLQLYKSFNATLVISEGLAKWTFTFEKATLLSPIPELYGPLVIAASTLVDAYLLINN
ncbi:hypothetical protein ACJIZ3_014590 [Penstemon smallii]|uniref:Bet v I/Major latex protein domain-containing protein n=1 Tax=Penstemon smallii TaxID=265156 RepID=A0ABD3RM13_9LAMI